jgi:uncharacterized protein YndB with AHSA1/START domain
MSKPEFVYVTYIDTTPEKLWQALIEPEFQKRYWSGYSVVSTWKPGAKVTLGKDGKVNDEGEVLAFDPPRRLSYTWHVLHDTEMSKEAPSRVIFEIAPMGKVVKLTVTHTGFEEGSKVLPAISGGWPMVLSSLKSLLERGQAIDIEFAKSSRESAA